MTENEPDSKLNSMEFKAAESRTNIPEGAENRTDIFKGAESRTDILETSERKWQDGLKKLVAELIKTADSKKADDILAVHVSDKTLIADWFIFMSGSSVIHVKTLCDELEDKAAQMGLAVKRREGYREGRWIVIDFSSILVHIFHPEEREYYNVERLWIDPATEVIRPENKVD